MTQEEKKTALSNLPAFDMAEHLQSEEDIAQYLAQVEVEADPAELSRAVAIVAHARRMRSND